ncbi:MAG: DUF692 domain-containing protein [Deltaproteobacteria bacterium]|nr:DUF692 domain-containing protein [Deltaproteobacteria bacterium]
MRPEIAPDLLAAPSTVDFVEIVAETCFTQRATRREAQALAEVWPVVPHGVKLSLGSAEGIDLDRARRLGELARELRAPVISEHVSFTRAGGHDIGHLTQLPRTRAAVAVVARNVARARTVLPDVPLLLENVAWSVLWPPAGDGELSEGAFHHHVTDATGCDLLLDVGNLYANAVNEGRDPHEVLAGYPLDRVAMVHVAGGVAEHGFYYDTHAHAVPDGVFALVAQVLAVRAVPVMIERDASFVFAGLAAELARLREMPRLGATETSARTPMGVDTVDTDDPQLAGAQAGLAAALVGPSPACDGFDPASIQRARDILSRKRIDDALPLLGQLSRVQERTRDLAARVLARHARPGGGAGPVDAWRIAEAALGHPELGDDAAIDHLVLRARFTGSGDGGLRPRRTPFIGYARLGDGRRVRATKGFGARAEVMLRRER